MKKLKLIIAIISIILTSGCFENDTMEDIDIYTTSYPIEYITNRLYGEHSTIQNIYPDGSESDYVVSDKLLKDYSKTDLFIFNGLEENNQNYVYKMLKNNKSLKIIDVSSSIIQENKMEELWLNPMNLLSIANNIKKGFNEYITSSYLTKEINENYDILKQELFKLDADYRDVSNRANDKTIVVSNDLFLYLSKYDLNVISLEENDNLVQKTIYDVENLIDDGEIKYIFTMKDEKVNDTINNLIEDTDIELIELHNLTNLKEEERKQELDYFKLMYQNLELLKKELYN